MKKIQIVTFKGCQSAVDFRSEISNLVEAKKLNVEVEMILVPSPEKAGEKGLYGSPTILIDGVEYNQERRGPAGYY